MNGLISSLFLGIPLIYIIIIIIIIFILPLTVFIGIITICDRLKKINKNLVNLINIEIENQNIMLTKKATQNNE